MKKTTIILTVAFVLVLSITGCENKAVEYTASSEEIVVPEEAAISDAATVVEMLITNEEIVLEPEDDKSEAEESIEESDASVQKGKDDLSDTEEKAINSEKTDATTDISSGTEDTADGSEVIIYYVQGNFEKFKQDKVVLDELTPDAVAAELITRNILPVDTNVKSFSYTESLEGKKILNLDFSSNFETYITTMSEQAEIAIVTSLTKTYIHAFDVECVHITVNGNEVKSSHLSYTDSFFETEEPGEIGGMGEMQAVTFD